MLLWLNNFDPKLPPATTGTMFKCDAGTPNAAAQSQGTVNVLKELTPEETEKLFDTYEDADYLIDAVEDEINLKLKGNEIHDFYRYIIGFATNTGWGMK